MLRVRVLGLMGKAKPKKHAAKEIAAKVDAATTNHGGGNVGLADRSGIENGGHARFECPLCKVTAPDIKSMQIHHKDCHPKIPFDDAKIIDLHASIVSTIANSSKPLPGKLIAPYYVNVIHGVSSSFGKSWAYGVLNGQSFPPTMPWMHIVFKEYHLPCIPVFHPRCLGCTSTSGNTIYLADQSSTHDALDAHRLQRILVAMQRFCSCMLVMISMNLQKSEQFLGPRHW